MPELVIDDTVFFLILAWLFSAAARGMPEPDQNASYFLRWLYNSLQLACANFDKMAPWTTRPPTKPK
jgi:hypothetical protein